MLHTVNKAWVTIIAKQLKAGTIKNALFAVADSYEAYDVYQWIINVFGSPIDGDHYRPYYIYTEDIIRSYMNTKGSNMPVFDTVLVSENIHDPIMKNYLSQHFRRKR